jgi:hypothetical protein
MSKHTSQSIEWPVVYRTMGLLAAEAVQGRLNTAGIPTVLNYDGMKPLLGIPALAGTGEVRILVPPDRLVEAQELLGNDNDVEDADL